MIAFADEPSRRLFAELKEAGLVTPIVSEAIRRLLRDGDAPSLEEFLLAGAGSIDDRQWLSWLIRYHGCSRFGPVRLPADARSWTQAVPPRGTALPANLPCLRLADGSLVKAILRPDLPETGYRAAATLAELRQLRRSWEWERP